MYSRCILYRIMTGSAIHALRGSCTISIVPVLVSRLQIALEVAVGADKAQPKEKLACRCRSSNDGASVQGERAPGERACRYLATVLFEETDALALVQRATRDDRGRIHRSCH